eukprot:529709_1
MLQKQMNKIEENLSIYVDAIKSTENMSLIATSNDIADLKTQLNDIADLKIQLNDIYSLIEKMDNVDNRDMVSIKSDDSIQSKENESVKLKQEIENEKMKLNQEIEKERKEENEYKSALDYEMQQIENAIKPTDQNQNTLVSFELFQPEINKISSKIENLEYTINNIYSQSKNDEYAMLQKQINENQKNILTYIEENISHKDESKNDEYEMLQKQMNKIEKMLNICVGAIKSTETMSAKDEKKNEMLQKQMNEIARNLSMFFDEIKSREHMLQVNDNFDDDEMSSIKTNTSSHSFKLKYEIENEREQKELFDKECEEEKEYKHELRQIHTYTERLSSSIQFNYQDNDKIEAFINDNAQNENTSLLFQLFEPEMNKLSSKMDTFQFDISDKYNDIDKNNEIRINDLRTKYTQELEDLKTKIDSYTEQTINRYQNIYSQMQSNAERLENHAKHLYEFDQNNKTGMNDLSVKYSKELEDLRTKIGLDISQNIRYINEQQQEFNKWKLELQQTIDKSINESKSYWDSQIERLTNIMNESKNIKDNKLIGDIDKNDEYKDNKSIDILKYMQEKDESKKDEYEMLQKQMNENQKDILTYIQENITYKESFKNISDSIQQKKTYDQEILGNIKNDMNKILNNVAKFNERGNKEIESLKQQLQMYEKQEDMLKYIQENIAHKDESKADEYDMLQKQMNENQKNILTYIEENISHKDESKNDE